jgi:hypothetical protein
MEIWNHHRSPTLLAHKSPYWVDYGGWRILHDDDGARSKFLKALCSSCNRTETARPADGLN